MIRPNPIIALDCDGVLLDYNLAYASLWERAFGYYPKEINPDGYTALQRWDVKMLEGKELQRLRDCTDWHFWSTMPALPGAVDACKHLVDMGYELVCVTAIDRKHVDHRFENLINLGFPISHVYATGSDVPSLNKSPKADIVNSLGVEYFVDDFLPYFRGVDHSIKKILIQRASFGSPNDGHELAWVQEHDSLPHFVDWLSVSQGY